MGARQDATHLSYLTDCPVSPGSDFMYCFHFVKASTIKSLLNELLPVYVLCRVTTDLHQEKKI